MSNIIDKAKEEFYKTIKYSKNELENRIENLEIEKAIGKAVKLAYNDAKRTMTGIGVYEDEKADALYEIIEKLKEYFNATSVSEESEFDEKHKEMCDIWHNQFKNINKLGTYGKAQKIVNMAFKYLYCCKDAEEYKAYFKYCHVALDSFTLEWFVREVESAKEIVKKYVSTWSSIEEYNAEDENETYSYMFYQNEFRNLKSKNEALSDLTPFQKEFIMWPYYKNKLVAESFLIGLIDQPDNNVKNKIKRNSIFDNYEEIKYQINKVEESNLVQIFKNII